MDKIKFSIIMPAYGVEKQIRSSIESVIAQTYSDWELLVIDDASLDLTGEIAESFSNMDSKIKVIHHDVNRGPGGARNTGLKNASGEYVLFIDAGDAIEKDTLEGIFRRLFDFESDVVIFGCKEEYVRADGRMAYAVSHSLPTEFTKDLDTIHRRVMCLNKKTLYGYVWNKAYKKSLIDGLNLTFEKMPFAEDILFNIAYFDGVTSLQIMGDEFYHYRNILADKTRLTTKYVPQYFEYQKRRINELYRQQQDWDLLDEKTLESLAAEYFRSFLSMMEREYEHGTPKKEIIARAKDETKEGLYISLKNSVPKDSKTFRFLYEPLANGDFEKGFHRMKMVSFVRRNFATGFAKLKQKR